MDKEIKTWLYDVLNAIMEIESLFNTETKENSNITKAMCEQKERSKGILKSLGKH